MVMKNNTYRWMVLLWVLIHSTLSFAYDVGISPTASDFSEDKSIHATLSHELMTPGKDLLGKLSFSHIREFMTQDDPLARFFYETECIKGT